MKVHIDTHSVRSRDKIAFWVDFVCAHLIQADCRAIVDRSQFQAEVSKLSLPRLDIAQIEAAGQNIYRTKQHIARASEVHFLLNIQRNGESVVRQDGKEAVLRRGDCSLYSTDRPYELAFTADFKQTVLIFPESTLRALDGSIDRRCGELLSADHAATRLLLSLVDNIYDTADNLPPHIVSGAVDLLASTLLAASGQDNFDGRASNLSRYHVARVKEFILQHLSNSELSARMIAAGLGISVSHLYRLFAEESETLMAWVWAQRLEACRRDLADSRNACRTIIEIAFRWGFSDAPHFSKAFRNRFGVCPSE